MARHPRGSAPKLTEAIVEKIANAIRHGCYVETAVALNGLSKQTFYRWLKQAEGAGATQLHLQLSDAVKKAMAEAEARDLAVIDKSAQEGIWQAAAWRLERKHPERWGRQARVQVEHSGVEGKPIEIAERNASLKQILADPAAMAALEVLEEKLDNDESKPKP